jgi:phage gp46-like protein
VSDFALTSDAYGRGDFSLEAGDYLHEDGMRTAIFLSLWTDRLAEAGDVLPDAGTDRRGYWADAVPVVAGDRYGSRLWLLRRSKRDGPTLARAQAYAREALQWLVEDGVASAVEVVVEWLPAPIYGVAIGVTVRRPEGGASYRYEHTWIAEEAR